jgi:hypothetical protein
MTQDEFDYTDQIPCADQCRISVICVIGGKVFSGLRQKNEQGNDPEGNPQQEISVLFFGSASANLVYGEVVSL